MPASPRGWFQWSCYVLDAQARPFSQTYEYTGRGDHRMRDSRETALSVKIAAERASKACTSNGVGLELLTDFFVREASWYSFTSREQAIIRKVERDFRCRLCFGDFLAPCGRPRRSCRRSPKSQRS